VEAVAFGVALGAAAWFGHHHREVASVFTRVAHALVQESRLQSAAPQFGHGGSAAEQSYTVMHAEQTGRAGLAIDLCEKTPRSLTRRGDRAELA